MGFVTNENEVTNLNMEEDKIRARSYFPGTIPSSWFRYADAAGVKTLSQHTPAVKKNMSSSPEKMKQKSQTFEDYAVWISILTHTTHWNKTLKLRAEEIPTRTQGKKEEQEHLRAALKTFWYTLNSPTHSDKNCYTQRTRHKQSNIRIIERQEQCRELYNSDTKQPLHQ